MRGAFERKENDFWELKKINIYTHDTAIENSQVHHWSLKNQDLHDLFLETLFWINLCPAWCEYHIVLSEFCVKRGSAV